MRRLLCLYLAWLPTWLGLAATHDASPLTSWDENKGLPDMVPPMPAFTVETAPAVLTVKFFGKPNMAVSDDATGKMVSAQIKIGDEAAEIQFGTRTADNNPPIASARPLTPASKVRTGLLPTGQVAQLDGHSRLENDISVPDDLIHMRENVRVSSDARRAISKPVAPSTLLRPIRFLPFPSNNSDTTEVLLHLGKLPTDSITHVVSSAYLNMARTQMVTTHSPTSVLAFTDEYGYIASYLHDTTPDGLGEGTFYTAVAVIALATSGYAPDSWDESQANTYMAKYLNTLTTSSWGYTDELHQTKNPIRHPAVFNFNSAGVKFRNDPMSKDGVGAIIAGCYYAYKSPVSSPGVRSQARALLQEFITYFTTHHWMTHSSFFPGEFESEEIPDDNNPGKTKTVYKNIFSNAQGGRVMFKGVDTYTITPLEIYALQGAGASMGIVTTGWDVWSGAIADEVSYILVNQVLPDLANQAANNLRDILDQIQINIPYQVRLGPAEWTLGVVSGAVSISMSSADKSNIVEAFRAAILSALKTSATIQNIRANTVQEGSFMASIALDKILDLLPDVFGFSTWKRLLLQAIQQVVPWTNGDVMVQLLTMLIAIGGLVDDSKPFVTSFTLWSFAALCETRPDLMLMVNPFASALLDKLKHKGDANALWAWFVSDYATANTLLDTFEAASAQRWSTYAFGADKFDKWLSDAQQRDRTTPRLDYLVLYGLMKKGAPESLAEVTQTWLQAIKNEAAKVWTDLVQQIRNDFAQGGAYTRRLVDSLGRTFVETWRSSGSQFVQDVFYSNVRIFHQDSLLDGLGRKIWWSSSGALTEAIQWAKVLADGSFTQKTTHIIRDATGVLTKWTWATNGDFQFFGKWSTSTLSGGAAAVDMVEQRLRQVDGVLEAWSWANGGVIMAYTKWGKSLSTGAAGASDVITTLSRNADGVLRQWWYEANSNFKEFAKWWRSTSQGEADAVDLVERRLRDPLGPLDHWYWTQQSALSESFHFWTSAVDGSVLGSSLTAHLKRDVQGQLERWYYDTSAAFLRYDKWARSTASGGAQAIDVLESIVRYPSGIKERFLSNGNGVSTGYYRWWRSTPDGVAAEADLVEKKLRNELTQYMERTLWGTDGVFTSYVTWWRSASDLSALGADVNIHKLRDAGGLLRQWVYASDGAFQSLDKWSTSTVEGAAQAIDEIERHIRDATGYFTRTYWSSGVFTEVDAWYYSTPSGVAAAADIARSLRRALDTGDLQEWLYYTDASLAKYSHWWQSNTDGTSAAANMVERTVRVIGNGPLEKSVWAQGSGVFQNYYKWSKSTEMGGAAAADMVERLTQLADGNRLVETWDAARNYFNTLFDSAGNWISGTHIPMPKWPPSLPSWP